MSSDEHAIDETYDALSAADIPHQEAQKIHSLLNVGTLNRPGGSYRFVAEPCAKHAKNPPGEQTWVEDSEQDPVTGLQQKKRDPNGFVHGCAECEANATVIKEG